MELEQSSIESTHFPKQKISYLDKNEDWKKRCVDGTIAACNVYRSKRRSSFANKRRNYDLYNNKINKEDFDHVLKPFDLTKADIGNAAMPASVQPYDVLSTIFNLLLGDGAKRFFSPIVVSINPDSITAKEEKKKQMILQSLREYLTNQEMDEEQLAKMLNKYKNYSERDINEVQASDLLEMVQQYEKTNITFSTCFQDALISSEQITDPCEIAGEAKLIRINPLEMSFDLPSNSSLIDHATKTYVKNRMSIPEIIDEFYEHLTPGQIDDLEAYGNGGDSFYNYDFNHVPVQDYFGDGFLNNVATVNSIDDLADNTHYINVHRVRWKSFRKVGTLHYLDEFNKEQTVMVDETFKFNKKANPDMYIDWFWISEAWEGIRIGQDLYPYIRPRKNQFRSITNLSECKLGYVGTVYSALNSQAVSLMDRLVPWLYLYLIMWYRTELLIAANQGQIALIDVSLIPDGWEVEKWLYYATAMKMGFVDTFKESLKRFGGGQNQSTQNKALNLKQGDEIQHHISILEFIEKKIEDTSGVPRQRKGEITSSEKVGNTERVVSQSSTITEPYFTLHDDFKLRSLDALLKVAQDIIQEKGDKAFQYISDDMTTVFGTIDSENFPNADFRTFISNSRRDQEVLAFMQEQISAGLQNDKLEFSMVADIVGSKSIAKTKAALKDAEQLRREAQERNLQADRDIQTQMHQEQMDFEYEKLDREDANKAADREASLLEAEIKAIGTQAINEPDANANGVPDVMEVSKLALEQVKHSNEIVLKGQELTQKKQDSDKAHSIKEKEIKLKEKELTQKAKIEQQKAKLEKDNMKNDLQIARINLKGRNKAKPKK